MDYAATDPVERTKHPTAQRKFFDGPQPFYARDEVQYDQAYARMIDWFAFEYRDKPNRPTPFQNFCLRHHRKWPAQQRPVFEAFRDNVYSTFEVTEVTFADSMVLRDLASDREYPIREKAASCQLQTGHYVVGRIFPFQDYHVLSGAMCVWPESARETVDAAYEKSRASGEWFHFSPLDMEAMLREALLREDIADELEAEFKLSMKLKAFAPHLSVATIYDQIGKADSLKEVLDRTLSECTFESDREAEGMGSLIRFLWNRTRCAAPADRDTPAPVRGSIEESLFAKFTQYVEERLGPEGSRESATARAELGKLKRQWMNTRQKILGYRTPSEVIEQERQRRGC